VLAPWRGVLANVRLPLEIVPGVARQGGARSPAELLELVGLNGFKDALVEIPFGRPRARPA
jgi:ABC-type nitrate/sulfonate/bicarbonate transport system ATPase subunit